MRLWHGTLLGVPHALRTSGAHAELQPARYASEAVLVNGCSHQRVTARRTCHRRHRIVRATCGEKAAIDGAQRSDTLNARS